MPHRDDFEAALARIAALENELERARDNSDEALRAENARLAARVEELEDQLAAASGDPPDDDDEVDEEHERRTAELLAKLHGMAPDERARWLVGEAERVAITEPLREVVEIARRFVEGDATAAELGNAEAVASQILGGAYQDLYKAQVARVQSLDSAARSVQQTRDTGVLTSALAASDPSVAAMELVKSANVIWHVVAELGGLNRVAKALARQ